MSLTLASTLLSSEAAQLLVTYSYEMSYSATIYIYIYIYTDTKF